MGRSGAFSVSARTVYPKLGTATAPLLLGSDGAQIAGAVRRSPAHVHLWRAHLSRGRLTIADALTQLQHGMVVYDAPCAWCRQQVTA